MKSLILFILVLTRPLWALTSEQYRHELQSITQEKNIDLKTLEEKIKLFELDQQFNRAPSIVADSAEIILQLQNNLLEEYQPQIEQSLGTCDEAQCLTLSTEGARLKTAQKEICFPYTHCGFYKCMEEKYRCSDVGVDYFTKLAYPTCSAYVVNLEKNKFTQKGVEWIYNVMVCLQKGLVQECDLNNNCQQQSQKEVCDHIIDYTLSFHPSCYINSGVGVCKLPLKDQINIWKTVGPYLTDRERVEAFKVVAYCLKNK